MKQKSIFYTGQDINISYDKYQEIESGASWWMERSYDELSNLMFSNSLLRSWFVLSYGNCPKCGNPVIMYNWKIDAKNHPFKVQCPHCETFFPENDFESFYKSGLDQEGGFSYELADRTLLGNGPYVDDGNGYVHTDGEIYRFIAYYLSRGQWEQLIADGINTLSLAYLVTKEQEYARRAMLLLYSVSRFYSDFDFMREGLMYEKRNWSNGYVNYWVISCNDTKYFILAYDRIFDGVKNDKVLEEYLSLPFSKIQQSIEENIFIDTTRNVHKIFSNPPSTDIALLYIKIVLSYHEKKQEIMEDLDKLIIKNTLIDGLPGEKSVSGYASIGPNLLLEMLSQLSMIDENLLFEIFKKHPVLYKSYRFHIDSWYMNQYYPYCGDSGYFNMKSPLNASLKSHNQSDIQLLVKHSPSWFALQLSRFFKDTDFLKVIYINQGYTYEGLFQDDLYMSDQDKESSINDIRHIIETEGTETRQKSINYEKYRMAFLHSGKLENKRMAFMIYESGANHSHKEALNIGLYFKGRDIMSGFGYAPVAHGGWFTDEVKWYWHPSSHNIVVIDNQNHVNLPEEETFLRYPQYGKTLLFEDTPLYKVICAEAREYADANRFERLLAMIDIDEKDAYCVDVFKVDGGHNHRKFQRSSFMNLKQEGLTLNESNYDEYKFMRNFRTDEHPSDIYAVTFYEEGINFRYTDLTHQVKVSLCESWVDTSLTAAKDEEKCLWIPTLMIEKEGPISTFVSLMEVFESHSRIRSIERKGDDSTIELIITLDNGHKDYIFFDDEHHFKVKRI
ncbi:MAG: heparinase II/III family protein [Clostridia bacterium]|nr:heparinase II/III family protein [Clostridia bacterium]